MANRCEFVDIRESMMETCVLKVVKNEHPEKTTIIYTVLETEILLNLCLRLKMLLPPKQKPNT